jgi:hypothetical protein
VILQKDCLVHAAGIKISLDIFIPNLGLQIFTR